MDFILPLPELFGYPFALGTIGLLMLTTKWGISWPAHVVLRSKFMRVSIRVLVRVSMRVPASLTT